MTHPLRPAPRQHIGLGTYAPARCTAVKPVSAITESGTAGASSANGPARICSERLSEDSIVPAAHVLPYGLIVLTDDVSNLIICSLTGILVRCEIPIEFPLFVK